VTLTFDFLTFRVFHVQCFSCPTHLPIFIILQLSVTELWITEFDHISIKRHCHCACAVSRDLSSGGKNGPHFWNPWPKFTYSLCQFQGATTKIKPCYMREIAFTGIPLSRLQSSLHMRSILWLGGPPKPHVTIFWPQIIYSLYNFYEATTTIKGSFILEHPHVKAIFGRKKTKSSQNQSPKWRFFGNLRV